MNKIISIAVCFMLWLMLTKPVLAQSALIAGASASLNGKKTVINDTRAKRLKKFLFKYNSPLISYTDYIVSLADKYGIDYRLVVAISGVESTFCKAIPYNSYNCWGWKNGRHAFSDYSNALEKVSKTLSLHYYNKGFDTPETIGPIYAPPSPDWAWKVRYFLDLLEEDITSTFLAKQFSI